MAIDAGIFQNFLRPPKTVQEYDAEAQQVEGNKLGLLLQRGQYDAQQRGVADDAAHREAVKGFGADAVANANMLRARGLGKQAMDYEKSALDAAKTSAEVANLKKTGIKLDGETVDQSIKRYRGALDYIDTPQGAARWLQAQYADPVMSQHMQAFGPLDEAVKRIPQTPAEFEDWRARAGMGMDAYAKKVQEDQKIAETARNNKAQNGIAARNADTAAGQLGVARQRLTLDQQAPKGQIVQSDQGMVLVDPRTGQSTPIKAPDGTPLAPKLKDLPTAASAAIMSNAQGINKVEQAIALLDGKNVGALKGDASATGWKGYAPQAILNRADPSGVDTRAMVTDIGSLILHDRSGAAVTASETPRLLPFIPLATDDNATARKKLVRFKQIYEQEQQAYLDTYSKDQGYKTPKVPANMAGNSGSGPKPGAVEDGHRFKGGDPSNPSNWEKVK